MFVGYCWVLVFRMPDEEEYEFDPEIEAAFDRKTKATKFVPSKNKVSHRWTFPYVGPKKIEIQEHETLLDIHVLY